MNLATLIADRLADQALSVSERGLLCCQLAKQFEDAGEYDEACEALVEFWPARQAQPATEGLDPSAKAEVLLRVGALTGWTGSTSQAAGAQETAKDLISRAIDIFNDLEQTNRVAEARSELAVCYWREGAFDEARIILLDVMSRVSGAQDEIRAIALLRMGLVEKTAGRYSDALRIYAEARAVIDAGEDHALKGRLHNGLGTILSRLAIAEPSGDKLDQALMAFTAASFHFEQVGHTRYQASVENNLGFLYMTLGRFSEAHGHLNRARRLFFDLQDNVHQAQVDETRARALMAEGRLDEAERCAQAAVKTLDLGGEQSLLAEALTTHGTVLAHMGRIGRAKASLQRAVEVAQTSGDLEGAGRAYLNTIEQLGQQISVDEVVSNYKAALDLLQASQDPATTRRLISCAQKVIATLAVADEDTDTSTNVQSWDGFSFKQEVLDYERAIISRALRDTGGAVTKAARLLGFNHHQSLIALINSRHKGLLGVRSAVRKRRRSIIKVGKNGSKKQQAAAATVKS
ncbi:MAG TPA: tetratricopeptide repeat protein [Pyrinomonadaceae bacterium]|nr:tetratricopeptide repeat protein [Pyrinomonadaceae bacterium]